MIKVLIYGIRFSSPITVIYPVKLLKKVIPQKFKNSSNNSDGSRTAQSTWTWKVEIFELSFTIFGLVKSNDTNLILIGAQVVQKVYKEAQSKCDNYNKPII